MHKGFQVQSDSTDIREKGATVDGSPQVSDKRLFVQLLVFDGCDNPLEYVKALKETDFKCVLYADINNPKRVGLLAMSTDPDFFPLTFRDFLNESAFKLLTIDPDFTMFGRTYSIGFERDLNDWLIKRPPRVTLDPENKWAVWYPLKRKGEYYTLKGDKQFSILSEHGEIGRAFAKAHGALDVRLCSMGLNKDDNDFTIGVIGKDLHPLSAIVQRMRSTVQTSTYIEKMGPFFIGRVIYQGNDE